MPAYWASSRRFQLNTLATQRVSDRIEDDLCWVWSQAQWGAQGRALCQPSPAKGSGASFQTVRSPTCDAGRIGLGASLHFSMKPFHSTAFLLGHTRLLSFL